MHVMTGQGREGPEMRLAASRCRRDESCSVVGPFLWSTLAVAGAVVVGRAMA